MSQNRVDGEMPQLKQLQERWLRLPLSYRVNALLYFLGACATIFLVTALLRGGDDNPRQIQVGAGTATTVTTRPGPTSSSAASPVPSTTASASSTTAGGSTTTSRPTSTTAGSGGGGGSGDSAGSGGGGSGSSNTTAPPATSGTTTPSPPPSDTTAPTTPASTAPATTTTTARVCRNSIDPTCGQFRWDPAPNNQPLAIDIAYSPGNPRVGQDVTFNVTVSDPDHTIGTCAWLDFGDLTSQGNCQPPPCPPRYGPWDPPAPGVPGTRIFQFTHRYGASGPYIVTFFVDNHTDCYDPYAQEATKHAPIVIDPGT